RGDTRSLRHHRGRPLDVDVLLVDEASMVHLEMMADLVDALPEHARLVLLGDRDQLASVEAGAVLGELCAHALEGRYTPDTVDAVRRLSGQRIDPVLQDPRGPLLAQSVAMLRRSRRFGGGIARLARAVNAGDSAETRTALGEHQELQWMPRAEPAQVCELALREPALRSCLRLALDACADEASARDERALRVLRGLDDFRVLCAVRRGPWGVEQVNAALERALRSGGLLGEGAPWYEGRVVMVTRNDPDLGLFNGDVGVALRAVGGSLRVAFARAGGVRWISPGRLAHVETAFAMTVHKSQGSEFGHVALLLGPGPGVVRELLYTAITRARSRLSLLSAQPEVVEQGVQRLTRRSGGLAWRLRGRSDAGEGKGKGDESGRISS
ncbi:MAG: exodeoxyribonuclease V subunit alpha, partial [Betaproteobacteria bacterium]|nr:exodeoxyribonuclease V subunit alpha [Betaproteobacteria bacterium]